MFMEKSIEAQNALVKHLAEIEPILSSQKETTLYTEVKKGVDDFSYPHYLVLSFLPNTKRPSKHLNFFHPMMENALRNSPIQDVMRLYSSQKKPMNSPKSSKKMKKKH